MKKIFTATLMTAIFTFCFVSVVFARQPDPCQSKPRLHECRKYYIDTHKCLLEQQRAFDECKRKSRILQRVKPQTNYDTHNARWNKKPRKRLNWQTKGFTDNGDGTFTDTTH